MARNKLTQEEKRKEFSISVDIKLNEKLEKYMIEKGYSNKSKYIEKLIKDDLIRRDEKIDEQFLNIYIKNKKL